MTARESTDRLKQDAIERSRDCPYCDGQGLARIYDRAYDGRAVVRFERAGGGSSRLVTMAVYAHCLCPLGRWMRGRLTTEEAAGIPDVQDVVGRRTRWQMRDPTEGA